MFIRKKKNSSGSITVLIIEKRNRKNIILKNIGTSTDAVEIDYLYSKALKETERLNQSPQLPFDKDKELEYADSFTNCIDSFYLIGPELLLGKLFDDIGFNAIPEGVKFLRTIKRTLNPPPEGLRHWRQVFLYAVEHDSQMSAPIKGQIKKEIEKEL